MNLRYGSVCSGLEAASQAWEPLGWTPAWFAEIEPFPSAVLAHHWPHVQNLGDMTKIAAAITAGDVEAPEVLVGGTPCQAFSVAGRRAGLDDARGQLTLSYVELADAIDNKRRERGEQPVIIVWENVPGVLSSKDNAFGCFLAELAGESSELQPAGGKWTYAGCVSGPKRVIAWRTIDAQFCGVAQRRRRTFVVASAHPDIDPTEILFELDSLRRDTPPSRTPGAQVAAPIGNSLKFGSHWDSELNPHPTLNQSNNIGGVGASNQELFSQRGACLVPEIVGALDTECRFSKATDQSLRNGHILPIRAFRQTAFGEYADDETASTCCARDYKDATDLAVSFNWQAAGNTSNTLGADEHITGALQASQHPAVCITGDITHCLKGEGFDGSEDGTGRGQPIVAFQPGNLTRGSGAQPNCYVFPTLKADHGRGISDQHPHVAYSVALRGRDGGATAELGSDIAGALRASTGGGDKSHVLAYSDVSRALLGKSNDSMAEDLDTYAMHDMQVRRLMPIECERLQGMADNFTQIPWRNKPANECPDGPRYKAIGNSMAVPVMRWIGERIQAAMESIEKVPALNPYCAALAAQRVESEHYLKDVGDQWRTPDALFWGINAMFGPITLDLFADADNAKCDAYYTAEDNALTQDWSERLKELGGAAYANPPYSRAKEYEGQYVTGMRHIIDHAMAMREKGGRYIFLIKAATSEVWWPEEADHVAFIRGRIGFDLPVWFKPADEKQKPTGAFFAGAVVVLDKQWRGPAISYVTRDDLITRGDAFLAQVRRMAEKLVGVAA